jgi:hypothetical protein
MFILVSSATLADELDYWRSGLHDADKRGPILAIRESTEIRPQRNAKSCAKSNADQTLSRSTIE